MTILALIPVLMCLAVAITAASKGILNEEWKWCIILFVGCYALPGILLMLEGKNEENAAAIMSLVPTALSIIGGLIMINSICKKESKK